MERVSITDLGATGAVELAMGESSILLVQHLRQISAFFGRTQAVDGLRLSGGVYN